MDGAAEAVHALVIFHLHGRQRRGIDGRYCEQRTELLVRRRKMLYATVPWVRRRGKRVAYKPSCRCPDGHGGRASPSNVESCWVRTPSGLSKWRSRRGRSLRCKTPNIHRGHACCFCQNNRMSQNSDSYESRTNMKENKRARAACDLRLISETRAPALYNAALPPPSLFFNPHPSDLPDWSLGSRYTSQGLERQEVHSCAFCRLGADALRG